jgi:hypothetical protein
MSRKSVLFNSTFEKLGHEHLLGKQMLLPPDQVNLRNAQKVVVSEFCEQMLLFDRVSLKADRWNFSLYFLIREFGIDTIQQFIERGMIEILLWTPLIVTSTGMQLEDGSIDENAVLGKPPLVSGSLTDEDSDPENNFESVLKQLTNDKGRIKSFIKAATKATVLPNNNLAAQSVDLTIDAYKSGKLLKLGMENDKNPEDLNVQERLKLMELSHDVLETSILAQYEYKSLNKYSYSIISSQSLENIGKALHVQGGSKTILTLESVPDLKTLFLTNQLSKKDLKTLRYKSVAKTFRKWLNEVVESENCSDISKEYINEITGKKNFWDSPGGKIVKNVGMLGVGAGLGTVIGGLGIAPVAVGAAIGKGAELGLGLFDSFYLDGLLKGRNPRMFVEDVEQLIENNQQEA